MLQKVRDFAEKHHMLAEGDHILVGVSGGCDSVCLLHVLKQLSGENDFKLRVVHVNHGLRQEEADIDEQFTLELCKNLNIPCTSVKFDVAGLSESEGIGTEEAGRQARYRIFLETAEEYGCNKLAVAHHIDDNVETVLFRLFRGTGVTGIAGIAPVRQIGRVNSFGTSTGLTVIRPFLAVRRNEIEQYAAKRGILYCTDSTNAENCYRRNVLRNSLIPLAETEINAQMSMHVHAFSEQCAQIEHYLEQKTEECYQSVKVNEEITDNTDTIGNSTVALSIQKLVKEEPLIAERVVRKAMEALTGSLCDISLCHCEQVYALMRKQVGSRIDLPYGCRAERSYDQIRLIRQKRVDGQTSGQADANGIFRLVTEEELLEGIEVYLPNAGKKLSLYVTEKINISDIPKKKYTKWFDYDKIKGTLVIRTPDAGDWFQFNGTGGSKLLKDYFTEVKIPREDRSQTELMASGNRVLWLFGMRNDEGYRVTKETKRVLYCVVF